MPKRKVRTLSDLWRFAMKQIEPPTMLSVSEWAAKNRVLQSDSSSSPGRWRNEKAPFQREIMDSFTDAGVWKIVMMTSAQVGKTTMLLNMIGRSMDLDPGPMMYVQSTQDYADNFSKKSVTPLILSTACLKRKVFDEKQRGDTNTASLKVFPGGSLFFTGSHSPENLAGHNVRYLFMDEVDRYPDSAGREGSPIRLAERRTETFHRNRKIVVTSTPTIKGASKIEAEYINGTQEEWNTRCPACGKYHFITFDQIHFDRDEYEDSAGHKHFEVTNMRWVCPECGNELNEYDTKRCAGRWIARNPKALKKGIRSFHMNALMSPWSEWEEIILAFLDAKDDPELLKTFVNTMLGESWEVRDRSGVPETLFARREHYTAEVPDGVLVLTMGIDTQDNRLEYEVVGWDAHEQSWGISRGVIPGRPDAPGVWDEVDELLDHEWETPSGATLRIMATFVDSGGHFTQDIYKQCAKRESRRVFAIKGEPGEDKPYCRPMKRSEGQKGMRYLIGVDSGKEAIMYATTLGEPGARYMHFPIEQRAGYDMEYFRGLCSEKMQAHRKMGQTVMQWTKIYERNEPLDCRNYARAAYKNFKWNFPKYEKLLTGDPEEEPITQQQAARRRHNPIVSRGIRI